MEMVKGRLQLDRQAVKGLDQLQVNDPFNFIKGTMEEA